jgi:hypothetical protein
MSEPPSTEEILASEQIPDLPDLLGECYDKEGRLVTLGEWSLLRKHPEYARIAETTVGPYWISTVWIGLNHGWASLPLIFETMVFNRESGESDLDCRRYSTLEQAKAGHEQIVSEVSLFESLELPPQRDQAEDDRADGKDEIDDRPDDEQGVQVE